jgi:DNA-binding transcriptional MerR regulator
MRIGDLAREAGTTSSAIRYYERAGLLAEAPRTAAGYRDHGPEAIDRLAFIRSGQRLGLSLTEIRSVIQVRDRGLVPCEHALALVEEHERAIGTRIRELQQLRRELREIGARGRELDPADCPPDGVCQVIPPSRAATAG